MAYKVASRKTHSGKVEIVQSGELNFKELNPINHLSRLLESINLLSITFGVKLERKIFRKRACGPLFAFRRLEVYLRDLNLRLAA